MEYNGGSVIAMAGKDCVAIASDLRLGNQMLGISPNFQRVWLVLVPTAYFVYMLNQGFPCNGPYLHRITWPGHRRCDTVRYSLLDNRGNTDFMNRRERFRLRVNMYTIKEEREIEPEAFTHLVSSTLYEHRFGPYFIEPVVAGISKTPTGGIKPFIAATDLIGCINFAKDFVVAGTASSKLFGVAEGLWEPDLGAEDLFETISQTLLNAVDRDAFSGWGAVVHVM
jgi:20S proteasome subunit beta 3